MLVLDTVAWAILGDVCKSRSWSAGAEMRFSVQARNDNREGMPPLVRLKAFCGPATWASRSSPSSCSGRTDREAPGTEHQAGEAGFCLT
jgi:hypothetical protein